jgi:hypothetical protein
VSPQRARLLPHSSTVQCGVMQTSHARRSLGIILMLVACGCSRRVPEQKSFKLYTDVSAHGSVDLIARGTAETLHLKTSVADLPIEGGAVSHDIELYGHGYSIFVLSADDQQCYVPGVPRRPTFNKGLYDVTIARTGFLPDRSHVREFTAALSRQAIAHGGHLTERQPECAVAEQVSEP